LVFAIRAESNLGVSELHGAGAAAGNADAPSRVLTMSYSLPERKFEHEDSKKRVAKP
jgi:hypothetical protein